jgi:hypothetical protein
VDLYDSVNIFGPDPMDNMSNWCLGCLSIGDFWDDWCIDIPDLLIDNALIWETEIRDAYEAYLVVNHTYEFSNIIPVFADDMSTNYTVSGNFTDVFETGAMNWSHADWAQAAYCQYNQPGAVFWNSSIYSVYFDLTSIPVGLDCTVKWLNDFGYLYVANHMEAYIVTYDGTDTETDRLLIWNASVEYEWPGPGSFTPLTGETESISFDTYTLANPERAKLQFYYTSPTPATYGAWWIKDIEVLGATDPATGYIEISSDGGSSWQILDTFIGTTFGLDVEDIYDITPWAGNDILIRFRVEGSEDSVDDRFWCINDLMISGKTDETAPTSSATMSGTMKKADGIQLV